MATAPEEVLGLAWEFLRYEDLARGMCLSRGARRRCEKIMATATRVEAVLFATSDLERMLGDARSALRVQCRPGYVLLFCTQFRRARQQTSELLRGLLTSGVLPWGTKAIRIQTSGVLGCTASGHALEVEEGTGILIVVLPEALAEVLLGGEELGRCVSEAAGGGGGEDALATTVIVRDCEEVMRHLDEGEDGGERRLASDFFGGIAQGKMQELRFTRRGAVSGPPQVSNHDALTIRWKRQRVGLGELVSGGLSAAHIQTMANHRSSATRAEKRQTSSQLIRNQKDSLATVIAAAGAPSPQAVAVFACAGRGSRWYGESSVEAELLHEAYKTGAPATERGLPALFGMFCGGELGPVVEGDSSSDLDSDSEREQSAAAEGAGAGGQLSAVRIKAAGQETIDGGSAQAKCSRLQGFTTVVGVLA